MNQVKSYRDLKVWNKAMDLTEESYRLSWRFPRTEMYGLTSQAQRASGSIPANIAEGHGRQHVGDYLHHLSIAYGSLMELETHFLIAVRLGYVKQKDVDPLLSMTAEIGRMLNGLIDALKRRQQQVRPGKAEIRPDP